MDTAAAALDRLCDPVHEVSAHFLIGHDGQVFQMVDPIQRAWHAGAGSWGGQADVNSRSIGIELDNNGTCHFPGSLMMALHALLLDLRHQFDIPPEAVIGHQDMAPTRKSDPGPLFDWQDLARAGHAVWPAPAPCDRVDPVRFADDLARFGYPSAPRDAPLEAVLAAFRDRFRGGATGPLDATDMGLARDLATRFPFDRGPVEA